MRRLRLGLMILSGLSAVGCDSSSEKASDRAQAGNTSVGGAHNGGAAGSPLCRATFDPTPQLLAATSFNADAVARAAAVVGSCLPDDGVDRNASHIWAANLSPARAYFRTATQVDCLANAACGCAAVEECLGWGTPIPTTSCSSGCSGSVFTACGGDYDLPDGYKIAADCGKLGLSCDPVAACVAEATVACDTDTYAAACDAKGRPQFCDDGFVQWGKVCSSLGLDCASGLCVGRGAACTNAPSSTSGTVELFGGSCSGKALAACVEGKLATIDCATMGPAFTCQTVGTTAFCGLASDCVPANGGASSPTNSPSCDGVTLTFCNAGRLEHVDCLTLGFAGCKVDESVGQYGCI